MNEKTIKVQVFGYVSKVFQLTGVFPLNDNDTHVLLRYVLLWTPLAFGFVISPIIHVCYTLSFQPLLTELIIEDVVFVLSVGAALYTTTCFVVKRKSMMELTRKLEDFSKFGPPSNLTEYVKFSNMFSKIFCVIYLLSPESYTLFGIWRAGHCEEYNLKYDMNQICGSITVVWYPIDLNRTPYKQLICLFFYTISFVVLNASGAEVLIMCLIMLNLITRVQHLSEMFAKAMKSQDKHDCIKQLKICFQYHKDILSLVDELNANCSPVVFVHITLSSLILGISFCAVVMLDNFGTLIHVGAWLSAVFIVCYFGQNLTDQFDLLQQEIFMLNWYEKDVEIQKDIKFMLAKLNKPVYFKSMGMGFMNLVMFQTVMRSAYSYLTLFMQTI